MGKLKISLHPKCVRVLLSLYTELGYFTVNNPKSTGHLQVSPLKNLWGKQNVLRVCVYIYIYEKEKGQYSSLAF